MEGLSSYVTALIYLPEYYNLSDKGKKKKIEKKKFSQTAEEIALDISGGGTWHRESPHYYRHKDGIWYDPETSELYRDNIRIFEFDVRDSKKMRDTVIDYVKDTLLRRFEQIAIYVKFVPRVEPVVVRVEQ
jgi:hypothetical protein